MRADIIVLDVGATVGGDGKQLVDFSILGAALARALFDQFHAMITSDHAGPTADLGKLSVLAGVREFPARIKCASLAWHTMKAAVAHQTGALALSEVEGPVSTE